MRLFSLALLALALFLSRSACQGGAESSASDQKQKPAPHSEPVDAFHPEREVAVSPAYGGSVTVHLANLPRRLNYALENSAAARWLLFELHEFLVQKDWEMWDIRPGLAASWETEDTLVLHGGRGEGNTNVLYGRVEDDGDHYLVTPLSPGHALAERKRVPKSDVESEERQTVFTFHLRDGVKWHDGHPLDARDLLFSWRLYQNPEVDCDFHRYRFRKIVHAEAVDERTVRFFYEAQYFQALETFVDFTILPAHLFDLTDPDHPRHDRDASLTAQAREINENPCNTHWIGLGPYRLKEFGQQVIEAQRYMDYFDPEHGGYIDVIRWRHIPNDDAAFQALINDELDFFNRLSSEDYFGAATEKREFTERFYKGYGYTGRYNYTPWNTRRPQFSDVRVRKALAHAFDMEEYRRTVAHGLAEIVTGPQFFFGPAYNHAVTPLAFDPPKAQELLAEAGWYDRDGDGVIDKDGRSFEFVFLVIAGNKAASWFAQKLQESLSKVGIRMTIAELEWASYIDKIYSRDFDAAGLSWSQPVPENDPYQLLHSS